jgi:DNA-binding NarL/FixJ family response regulator
VAEPALRVELSIGGPELAERVRDMLMDEPGFKIVAANDASDDATRAEVLITDTAGDLSAVLPQDVPVIVIEDADPGDALRRGAAAVLAGDVKAPVLRAATRAAAAGLTVVSAGLRDRALCAPGDGEIDSDEDAPLASLTARELQVLQLLAEGATNKEIARRLGITPHTAKFHVAAIAGKLGASGRTDVVAKAMRLGLVLV